METIYDWLSVVLFAGLALLFLQRSAGARPADDRVIHYLPPALGCAFADWLGNGGYGPAAAAVLAAVVAYIWFVLRPDWNGPKG